MPTQPLLAQVYDCMMTCITPLKQVCGLDGSSIEAEVDVEAPGRIEVGLLALQQPANFHFATFISFCSSAEDRVLK